MLSQLSAIKEHGEKDEVNYTSGLVSMGILYLMMGFITSLNDTLVPFFKNSFSLSYSDSSLVQFYFFLTYGLMSIPSGRIIGYIGYKKGIVTGFLIASFGAFLFLPAAMLNLYVLFLAALFILAIGIVMLQVAANPFITLLGPVKTASSRLTLIQGMGSVGTTLAPVFGAQFILSSLLQPATSMDSLMYSYLGITLLLILVAIYVGRTKLPVINTRQETKSAITAGNTRSFWLSFRNLRLGVWAIFFYVGAEVAIGSYLTNYIVDTLSVTEQQANRYVAFYWGFMLVGRLAGALILRVLQPAMALSVNAVLAIILIFLSVNTTGYTAIWCMTSVGIANSVMFAIIFSLSVKGLGNFATSASGLLSTAIVGGAVISLLFGTIRDSYSWYISFMVPLGCYLYILFFGLTSHKAEKQNRTDER